MTLLSKTILLIKFLQKHSSSLSKKRQLFAKFFGENLLKITSVPAMCGASSQGKNFYYL
jgi:hypothetical protein